MGDYEELKKELKILKDKLRWLQDKEEIRDVLTQYAFNADLNRVDDLVNLYTDDGIYTTDPSGRMETSRGKDQIRKFLNGPLHQSITGYSQHLQLDYFITVDGDTAKATGYQLLTLKWLGGIGIFRTAFRKFDFQRVNGRWLIKETISVSVGRPECQELVPKLS